MLLFGHSHCYVGCLVLLLLLQAMGAQSVSFLPTSAALHGKFGDCAHCAPGARLPSSLRRKQAWCEQQPVRDSR